MNEEKINKIAKIAKHFAYHQNEEFGTDYSKEFSNAFARLIAADIIKTITNNVEPHKENGVIIQFEVLEQIKKDFIESNLDSGLNRLTENLTKNKPKY